MNNYETVSELKRIYVFATTQIYDAEEENFQLTLKDFITQSEEYNVFYIDEKEEEIYKRITKTRGKLIYRIE